jgi:hypothetical protein
MEYSTVNTTSSGSSQYCPTKARFFEPSGLTMSSIALASGKKLAGDEGHHARDAGAGFENPASLLLEAQMADDLRHDFSPGACRHGLLHEIARYIDEQSITPEDLDSLWLANEMWLMGQHDRSQPTGLREGNEPAFSGYVARQIPDLV